MPGRNDFGILRSDFAADERANRAAELYAEKGLASEDVALGAVAGHICMLGLYAMRETDTGTLPADGVAFVHAATMMPRSVCRVVIECLTSAGLLRPIPEGGLYLVGFRDCYGPIIEARKDNAEAKRLEREEAKIRRAQKAEKIAKKRAKLEASLTSDGRQEDVPGTSTGRQTLPYEPFRSVPDVPKPPNGGGTSPPRSAANGHSPATLAPADRAVLLALDDREGKASGHSSPLWQRLRQARKSVEAGTFDRGEVVRLIDEATGRWPDVAQDVRRTFAMAENQRKGA